MKITNLEKQVGRFVLTIDKMNIEPGKIHGLVGHNGCGKTMLLKVIMGILKAERGTLDYEGLAMEDITLMSQRPYLLQDTVDANLLYPLWVRGIKASHADRELADFLLKKAGLYELRNQPARGLSSGERQKLSFIRSVIFNPKFIMMDETLSNLDPDSEEAIWSMISEIQEKEPITWLIVSHQHNSDFGRFDVVHKMEKGKYCGIIKG